MTTNCKQIIEESWSSRPEFQRDLAMGEISPIIKESLEEWSIGEDELRSSDFLEGWASGMVKTVSWLVHAINCQGYHGEVLSDMNGPINALMLLGEAVQAWRDGMILSGLYGELEDIEFPEPDKQLELFEGYDNKSDGEDSVKNGQKDAVDALIKIIKESATGPTNRTILFDQDEEELDVDNGTLVINTPGGFLDIAQNIQFFNNLSMLNSMAGPIASAVFGEVSDKKLNEVRHRATNQKDGWLLILDSESCPINDKDLLDSLSFMGVYFYANLEEYRRASSLSDDGHLVISNPLIKNSGIVLVSSREANSTFVAKTMLDDFLPKEISDNIVILNIKDSDFNSNSNDSDYEDDSE